MSNEPLWDIRELSRAVERALEVGYRPSDNRQVRAIPNTRAIRYYTTLGLLDRPAAMAGRKALYGTRHLKQLVAIKRLQAEGQSLVGIQQRLSGLGEAELDRLAHLPEPAEIVGSRKTIELRELAFWRQPPVAEEVSGAPDTPAERTDAPLPHQVSGVALASGVTLLLPPGSTLDLHDAEAIAVAAEPLIRLLARRGLLPPANDKGEES